MITEQQEQYFQTMEELFRQPGWKLFIEDLTANQQALKDSALSLETEKGFYVAKGRNQTFNQVLGFESLVTESHRMLVEDDA